MKQHLKAIFNSYSEIFFVQSVRVGILLFAITLVNPYLALAGLISVGAAYLFARFIHMGEAFLNSGFYTYNPLLVGLAIGYLFKITAITIFFLVTCGILTVVVTIVMQNIFSSYLKLPVLSLPFVIVSSIAYLASSDYSNLFVNGLYPHSGEQLDIYLPYWISGYFKSLGSIFFMPRVIPGIILSLIVFSNSRILFLLSIAGYYSGTLVTVWMVGSFQQAFTNINHFNFILIAMAVGGIFLIPSLKSYLLALIAVCISTILLDSVLVFWSYYGIPGFTLPFNAVSLSFVYVLGLVNYPQLTRLAKGSPEETLDYYLSNRRRYKGTDKTLMLPFSGKWTVWQGFLGRWTHQGSWKYAYDFIITDEEGNSHHNGGSEAADYYAFRKPVLSPVRGRVFKVIADLPDNSIGQVDKTNNWGNLVIIQDHRGFFVELSHFAQNSIKVAEGTWVERGAFLGLCGNSGYSPQPHIHVQVQGIEAIGSYTLPFSFISYISDGCYHANELPREGDVVEPLYWDKELEAKTSFILDNVYKYDVLKDGRKIDDLNLIVKMAPDGTFYFDSDRGKLYFGKHEGTFYFYRVEGSDPYLKTILMAMPRIPVACREDLQWNDHIPIGLATKGVKKAAVLFISSFYHDFANITVNLTCTKKETIEGTIQSPTLKFDKKTIVEWNGHAGFKSIHVDNIEIRRILDEKDHI